jgi:hypothetical protein
MRSTVFKLVGFVFILFHFVFGQDFTGSYAVETGEGELLLSLQSDTKGGYTGTLNAGGTVYSIAGIVQSGLLTGTVGDELDRLRFQIELMGSRSTLTMFETDRDGQPIPETAQTFILQPKLKTEETISDKKDTDIKEVTINNLTLSQQQISEIEKTYGIKPLPGNYWYDSQSGLYGVMGYPAYGFMYSGHQFGNIDRNASNGNTGVIVNGRELPQSEWTVWSYILGYWIQQGSYWLDSSGNAGYEGSSIPLVNLFVAAQQNAYLGRGGSGDNFWSTRFSAGNYDSGNTWGYVSVPGYGPMGYGF